MQASKSNHKNSHFNVAPLRA